MPIDFGAWIGQSSVVASQHQIRAIVQQARVEDKAFAVSFKRSGVNLPEQMVRIEFNNTMVEASSELGVAPERKATIFAPKGHPDIDDLDVRVWDTFVMDETEYTVMSVNRTLTGQIQCHCYATG